MSHRIGVIRGDGTGPEVVGEALKVLDAVGVATDVVEASARAYLAAVNRALAVAASEGDAPGAGA